MLACWCVDPWLDQPAHNSRGVEKDASVDCKSGGSKTPSHDLDFRLNIIQQQ